MPEPGLGYWIALIARRFRFLAAAGFLSGILSLGAVLLLPRWYEARASILPPREHAESLLRARGIQAAIPIESLLPYAGAVTMADVYQAIVSSDRVALALVDRFDLGRVFGVEGKSKILRSLRRRTRIVVSDRGVLEVRVESKDPELAAELANGYVEELDRVFRETQSSSAAHQREFLEGRLALARADLDSAEAALARLQGERGLGVLSRDMTEAATAAGELLGRRLALSVRLEAMDRMGIGASPARREIELELGAVEDEAARLPVLGVDVARGLRDVRIQEVLYQALAEQVETARLEEARSTRSVEVLDQALVPDRHVRPRRGLTAVAGALLGTAIAFFWVAYRESRS